jgi:hypothetical protein
VTDEAGKEEPLVILPLDEYEALIDGAFGPGEEGMENGKWKMEEDAGREALGANGEVFGEDFVLSEGEEKLEDIQIEDVPLDIESDPEALGPEEADIDEEALKSLWIQPEGQNIEEKAKEAPKKPARNPIDGEEGFYLESID